MRQHRSAFQRIMDAITLILIFGVLANLAVIVTAALGILPVVLRYVDLIPVAYAGLFLKVLAAVVGAAVVIWGVAASRTAPPKRVSLLSEALRGQATVKTD